MKAMEGGEINHWFLREQPAILPVARSIYVLGYRTIGYPCFPESRFSEAKFSLKGLNALFETCDRLASRRSFACR
jgi:hypothetical protein